ncbi:hypothetical protein ACGFN1_35470 [Streptomyces sp. NPDC048685]|uniref:hypothetical protein n=1 Tax=Streptomyces sp. NPDC048685 TaxID=3365584 RepID=UPI00371BA645
MLEAETGPPPALATSPRSYAFALLREKQRISNSEWIDIGHVYRTLADALLSITRFPPGRLRATRRYDRASPEVPAQRKARREYTNRTREAEGVRGN